VRRALKPRRELLMVYSVTLPSTSVSHPFSRETFSRRDDAERFIDEVRREEPELGTLLRIEEREREAGGQI
jgi:hypothetical protein